MCSHNSETAVVTIVGLFVLTTLKIKRRLKMQVEIAYSTIYLGICTRVSYKVTCDSRHGRLLMLGDVLALLNYAP